MHRAKLCLAGRFRLIAPDGRDIAVPSQKGRALLALLACADDGGRDRAFLRDMLWERSARPERLESLAQLLSRLKRTLQRHAAADLLHVDRLHVRLDLERTEIVLASDDGGELLGGLDLPGCPAWNQWLQNQRARLAAVPAPDAGTIAVFGRALPPARELVSTLRLERPPKPSVAVLPFEAGVIEDRALGLALADDLAMCLAHFPQLFVAGSGSAAAMAAIGLLPVEIANRLGVRYLVGGLILRLGGQLRITARLIDGDTGEELWGDRFVADGSAALEQEIANLIAPRIWSQVDVSERQVSLRRFGIGSTLYERWWQASAMFRSYQPQAVLDAADLANALAGENPACPFCNALAAFLNGLAHLFGLTPPASDADGWAQRLAMTALRAAPDNVEVLGYCAAALLVSGRDPAQADALVARALALMPGYQPALFWGGWADVAAGRSARARDRMHLALRINPATGVRGPTLCAIGLSLLQDQRPVEALHMLREAQHSDPAFPLTYPALLLAARQVGDSDAEALARSSLPGIAQMRMASLFQKPDQHALFAGLPEQA
jgi:TolB-like protein